MGVPGGYGTRVGRGRGNTGYPARCEAEAYPSEAGPGSPSMGLEWVGICCSAPKVFGGGTAPGPPLPAVGPAPLSWDLGMPPLGQYRRELTSFYIKLVKTAECHRKVCKRPLIVPISKTGPKVGS